MKSIYLIIFGLSSIFFLQSCNEEGLAGEINTLQKQCTATLTDVKLFDATEFPVENAKEYLSEMMPYFESFDKASLKTLVDLANTEKASRKVNLNTSELIKTLNYSKKQISALNTEFAEDSLSKALTIEYLKEEQKIYYKMKSKFEAILDSDSRLKENFDRLMPKAKHIVDSLKGL